MQNMRCVCSARAEHGAGYRCSKINSGRKRPGRRVAVRQHHHRQRLGQGGTARMPMVGGVGEVHVEQRDRRAHHVTPAWRRGAREKSLSVRHRLLQSCGLSLTLVLRDMNCWWLPLLLWAVLWLVGSYWSAVGLQQDLTPGRPGSAAAARRPALVSRGERPHAGAARHRAPGVGPRCAPGKAS